MNNEIDEIEFEFGGQMHKTDNYLHNGVVGIAEIDDRVHFLIRNDEIWKSVAVFDHMDASAICDMGMQML